MKQQAVIETGKDVLEKIEKFRELGVSYLILYFPDKGQLGLLRGFAEQVMSRFRDVE